MSSALSQIPLRKINGQETTLDEFKGKVLLIVNVASKCGLTPQYQGLETLYENYKDKGFTVLGFPANEFGSQEPGSNPEIQSFCQVNYGVKFPMFEKIVVKGEGQHLLYQQLTKTIPEAIRKPGSGFEKALKDHGLLGDKNKDITWNFEKFLIDRHGEVVGRFNPDVEPLDPLLVKAIEKELAAKPV